MITIRSNTISRMLSAGAALGLVIAAAAPASAAFDPDTAVKSDAMQRAEQTLSKRALKLKYCVAPRTADGTVGKKECKTRENWIREGHDPLGQF